MQLTTRLQLNKPADGDAFDETPFSSNMDVLDGVPGIGTYTLAQINALSGASLWAGRLVYDTDNNQFKGYVGTTWYRLATDEPTGLVPVGAMMDYSGSSDPSSGPGYWIICDGRAISRSTYTSLFGLVGTTYGIGNNVTTFNIPDCRSRVVVGAGQGSGLTNRSLAGTGGEENHTLTTTEIPAHSHGVSDPGHNHTVSRGPNTPGTVVGSNFGFADTQNTGNATTGISIQNAGGGGSHANMQPWLALNKIIRIL